MITREGTFCTGDPYSYANTFDDAVAECLPDSLCGCIDDNGCDGKNAAGGATYRLRRHGRKHAKSGKGTCAWVIFQQMKNYETIIELNSNQLVINISVFTFNSYSCRLRVESASPIDVIASSKNLRHSTSTSLNSKRIGHQDQETESNKTEVLKNQKSKNKRIK